MKRYTSSVVVVVCLAAFQLVGQTSSTSASSSTSAGQQTMGQMPAGQQMPAGSMAQPRNNIASILVSRPKPGSEAQYIAARKAHIAWHKAQNDKWEWRTFEVIAGENTGAFVTGNFSHEWKEFDDREKFAEADAAEVGKAIAPHALPPRRLFVAYRADLSTAPESGPASPYIQVTHFMVKPDSVGTFTDAIKKINAARQKTSYPSAGAMWYSLVSGGHGPQFTVVVPRKSFADMVGPEKTMDQMVMEAYGADEGAGVLKAVRGSYTGTETEFLKYRPDLSYTPGK